MLLRRMLSGIAGIAGRVGSAGGVAGVAGVGGLVLALAAVAPAAALSTFGDPGRFDPTATVLAFTTAPTLRAPANTPALQWIAEGGSSQPTWFGALVTEPALATGLGSGRYVGNIRGFPDNDRFSDIGLLFNSAQDGVGFRIGALGTNADASVLSISVLTGASQTFEITHDLADPGAPVFLGITDPEGIREVRWKVADGGFFGIDDVTFGAVIAQIPEPGAAGLVGLGLLALAARRRR